MLEQLTDPNRLWSTGPVLEPFGWVLVAAFAVAALGCGAAAALVFRTRHGPHLDLDAISRRHAEDSLAAMRGELAARDLRWANVVEEVRDTLERAERKRRVATAVEQRAEEKQRRAEPDDEPREVTREEALQLARRDWRARRTAG